MQPIETVGEATLRQIRGDVITGALAPASKIRLEQAKVHYGVSVSTLREILNRLVAENLVVAEGQKGFQVAPTSKQELSELADLRSLLENHAIGLSFSTGDLDWEAGLVAAHHKLAAIERRILNGDASCTSEWVRYDWEFHRALVASCNSLALMNTLSSVFDRFLRYHLIAESFRGAPVVEDHQQLFERAMNRDVDGARAILNRHVHDGTEHVLKSGRIR